MAKKIVWFFSLSLALHCQVLFSQSVGGRLFNNAGKYYLVNREAVDTSQQKFADNRKVVIVQFDKMGLQTWKVELNTDGGCMGVSSVAKIGKRYYFHYVDKVESSDSRPLYRRYLVHFDSTGQVGESLIQDSLKSGFYQLHYIGEYIYLLWSENKKIVCGKFNYSGQKVEAITNDSLLALMYNARISACDQGYCLIGPQNPVPAKWLSNVRPYDNNYVISLVTSLSRPSVVRTQKVMSDKTLTCTELKYDRVCFQLSTQRSDKQPNSLYEYEFKTGTLRLISDTIHKMLDQTWLFPNGDLLYKTAHVSKRDPLTQLMVMQDAEICFVKKSGAVIRSSFPVSDRSIYHFYLEGDLFKMINFDSKLNKLSMQSYNFRTGTWLD